MPRCAELNRNGTWCNRTGTYPLGSSGFYACHSHLGLALFHLVPPDPTPIPPDAPLVLRDGVPYRMRVQDAGPYFGRQVEYEPVELSYRTPRNPPPY